MTSVRDKQFPLFNNNNKNVTKFLNLFIVLSIIHVTTLFWQPTSLIDARFLTSLSANGNANDKWTIPLRMPDIKPDHGDQYLCMAHDLDKQDVQDEQQWIVGFKPKANSSRIHHIILYSCEMPGIYQPGEPKFVWDCSGMAAQMDQSSSFEIGPVCQGREQIIYGWALDAGELKLPDKVGFKVGANSGDASGKFLVLQVHYHGASDHNGKHGSHDQLQNNDLTPALMQIDNSGLILDMQSKGITKSAGVLLMSSTGYVKPSLSKHEITCQLDENDATELHPIYYRTHTHKFGYKVLGGKLIDKRTNAMGEDEFESATFDLDLIGERDPQEPEMFYPVVRNDMVIGPGDTIYAACYYNQTNPWSIKIGATSDDEMCNFYIMYWTDGPQAINQKTCVSFNPPAAFDS